MVQNYYSLKRAANKMILDGIQYLRADPTKSLSIPALTIEFQRVFGFTEATLKKLLKPYEQAQQISVHKDVITLYKPQKNKKGENL